MWGRALLAGNQAAAERLLAGWLELFGDRFYLELNRTRSSPMQEAYLHAAVALAAAPGCAGGGDQRCAFSRQRGFRSP